MANMTATTMAKWIPEVTAKKATVTYRSNTILDPLLDHSWEPELGVKKGDTINIIAFSQNSGAIARSTFGTAAGLSSELIATTETQVQLAVNKMAIYGFAIPKEDALQALPQYEVHLADGIGKALRLFMDASIAADSGDTDDLDGFTTVVGTDNVDVTEDDLITCMTNIAGQNAPSTDRFLVVSPATFASLLKIDRIVNQLTIGALGGLNANKATGLKGGPVYGFEVWESNNLGAGTAGKKCAAWQREALAIAVQQEVQIDREFSVIDGLITYTAGSIVFGKKMVKVGFGNELDGK